MFKKILASGFIAFGIFFSTSAFAFNSPGNPAGPINDFANIISDGNESALSTFLNDYEARTQNAVVVVTVPTLGDESIEGYSEELFKAWGIGRKEMDNGILLLIAPNERQARIEVGYGLEGEVTDLESGQIINKILVPAFRNNDFDGGVSSSVHAIVESIDTDYIAPTEKQEVDKMSLVVVIIIIILFIILQIYARKKGWKGGGGAGPFIGGFILGGGGGGGGSSFGGFGGGSSGGGGASGRW